MDKKQEAIEKIAGDFAIARKEGSIKRFADGRADAEEIVSALESLGISFANPPQNKVAAIAELLRNEGIFGMESDGSRSFAPAIHRDHIMPLARQIAALCPDKQAKSYEAEHIRDTGM